MTVTMEQTYRHIGKATPGEDGVEVVTGGACFIHDITLPEPFEMVSDHHKHDFDQFLIFVGEDLTNMVDLGGEVELTFSGPVFRA